MTVATGSRRWREVKRRPVQGNPPSGRILRGPGCNRPKRVCADSLPATPLPSFPEQIRIPECVFLGMAESKRPDWLSWELKSLGRGTASRWSGLAQATQRRDGRSTPDCPSYAMSSGRLFLKGCSPAEPSTLHRHEQHNTHSPDSPVKGDISTLPGTRHFYFALPNERISMWQQSENVVFEQSRNVVLTPPSLGDAGRTTTDDAGR
jgi:hypothetical protein